MAMSFREFFNAYQYAALWTCCDIEGRPLDESFHAEDIADDARKEMRAECLEFWETHEQTWTEAGLDDAQAGTDFWLTRNGHGTGFWDRGLGEAGRLLSDAAKVYGSSDLYVGEAGCLYVA
jgi:hypothetical protein